MDASVAAELESNESEVKPKRLGFNGLSATEWASLSTNVWADLSSPRQPRHKEHGAVFPLKLADRLVRMYSAPGDVVFDPFNGIGTTILASKRLERHGVGIELNPRFVEMTNEWLAESDAELLPNQGSAKVHHDDCRNMAKYLEPNSVALTVTSPPYANFIQRSIADREKTHKKSRIVLDNKSVVKQYSQHEDDFGNLDYDLFLEESKSLFESLLAVTKPDGYAVWVVKDYRLPPDRPYISMHSDLARAAQDAGWLWHDLIVWDQNAQRRLVLLGFPTRFYTNQNCSFLVVLRKKK
jgi:DNA modification methylase